MSKKEYIEFNNKLAFHTAPTLLGIKCASLVSLSSSDFNIEFHLEHFNRMTEKKGLKSRILCVCGSHTLVLVYREKLLSRYLSDLCVQNILMNYGYSEYFSVAEYLDHLSSRIENSEGFPHEIGFFLGYPVEDVEGFIRNKGQNYKLSGAWKVYSDVEHARKVFNNYDKCRNFLCNKLNMGVDFYHALRIS